MIKHLNFYQRMIINIMNFISGRTDNVMEIEIPNRFKNCEITICNYFVAVSDDNILDKMKIPLPTPRYRWSINSYRNEKTGRQIIQLIDNK